MKSDKTFPMGFGKRFFWQVLDSRPEERFEMMSSCFNEPDFQGTVEEAKAIIHAWGWDVLRGDTWRTEEEDRLYLKRK